MTEAQRHPIGRIRSVPLWCWWILIVLGVSLPSVGFTPHPQWGNVTIVPFTDPDDKPSDVIANIALFVPFGYSFARGRTPRHAVGGAMLAAAAVSLAAETTQLFSVTRDPSATDVSMAIAGAAIGAAWRTGGGR